MALTDATRLADFSSGVGTDGTLSANNINATGIVTAATLKVGSAITAFGGIVTATTFSGALSGNATSATSAAGLTGTPNITVGNITASSGDLTVRNVTGVAATFTGAVTVGGVLTYDDVTNVDSVGIITARSDVSIADSIFHTGDTNTSIRFPAADTFTVETSGSERLRVDSSGRMGLGTNSPSSYSNSTNNLVISETGGNSGLTLHTGSSNASYLGFTDTGDTNNQGYLGYEHSNNALVFATNSSERLRITSTGGVHFNNAELIERVSIVGNKLSAVPNVNLDNGVVHYYTTNETATATPNIISTAGINTSMATGDTMSVTILSKPNNAGYFPKVSIDGVATGITTYWSGGSAPSSAESSGVDVNVYQIIKTADATYDVLANTSNFA